MLEIINFAQPVNGNFLVTIIAWLIGLFSSIALGVILFTLILKFITLPFDWYSRASMRKNNIIMERMRPELEKLKEQYKDNKQLYTQKMMAIYKKNGYSMWGACLPTIITLVIFIVAINAFNGYSQFQNRQYFYEMSLSYNEVVYSGFDIDNSENAYISVGENGKISFKDDKLLESALTLPEGGDPEICFTGVDKNGNAFDIYLSRGTVGELSYFEVFTTNSFVKARKTYSVDGEAKVTGTQYYVIEYKLAGGAENPLASEANGYLTLNGAAYSGTTAEEGVSFITEIREVMAANTFRAQPKSLLWIKNIWASDTPWSHAVESEWKTFKQKHGYSDEGETVAMSEESYNRLIAKLDDEKNAPNGYLIMVVLTAGISILTQLIMTKSQKAQLELQSVDGQGMQTQKIMMWMMPILMGVFSLYYTAAFSIYIVVSSVFSIGTTLGINYLVDKKYGNQKGGEKQVVRGRVHDEKPVEKKNKKVKDKEEKGDFLKGDYNNKKHIRGRLK